MPFPGVILTYLYLSIRALLQKDLEEEGKQNRQREQKAAVVACLGNRKIRSTYEQAPSSICSDSAHLSWFPTSTCAVTLYAPVGYNEAFGPFGPTGPSARATKALDEIPWRIKIDLSATQVGPFASLTLTRKRESRGFNYSSRSHANTDIHTPIHMQTVSRSSPNQTTSLEESTTTT
ncbi:hypothetical protein DFH94DRAFT_731928 [Russula ochroleuca]|uniref:Uncharacterized protein n=1 Tax=Russula ochroleuca TaxID=152965 RepID=A0A9P5MY03_9AGAM|nr:hypothetical protein DFH94DRAFT_731928 [Russula ochroleuca]